MIDSQLFEAIVRRATDAVIVASAIESAGGDEPEIIFVNEAFTRMTGYSQEEATGKTLDLLDGAGTDQNTVEKLTRALIEGKPATAELLNYRKDGSTFWTRNSLFPLPGGQNRPDWWICIKRDITDQKKTWLELQEAIDRYDKITWATSDVIRELDIREDRVTFHKGVYELLGYKESDIQPDGTWWRKNIHLDDYRRVIDTVKDVLNRGLNRLQIEYRYRCADGTYKFLNDRAYIISGEDGAPERILASWQDITRQKENELQQKLLLEIAYHANREIPLKQNLADTMKRISEFFDCELAHIYRYEKTNGDSRAISWDVWENNRNTTPGSFIEATKKRTFAPGMGKIGKAVTENRILRFDITEDSSDEYLRKEFALQAGFRRCLMIPAKTGDGELVFVLEFYTAAAGKFSSKVQQTLSTIKNILDNLIDRQATTQKLRVERESSKAISKAINETIWNYDLKKETVQYNERFYTMFGYRKTDTKNAMSWWGENLHPADYPDVADTISTAVNSRGDRLQMQYRYRCSDGSYKHIYDRAYIIRNDEGDPVRIIGAMQDITPLVKREKRANLFRDTVLDLATDEKIMSGVDIGYSLENILKKSARALGVSRANFWLSDKTTIRCSASWEQADVLSPEGTVLPRKSCPAYFEQIYNNKVTAVEDARNDRRSKELAEDYLVPNDVYSLLDTTVRISGAVKAVICYEHTGETRAWTDEEISFAGAISDQVAQIFANAENKKKENQLQESLREKETLLQEIYHRVKNNLAVVSSLMQLQAFNSDNEELKKSLLDGTNRIQSMAIIHEELYHSGNFSDLDIQETVKDLIGHIGEVMKNKTSITVDYRVDKISLNINQAVPFSLIVNEVVTNIYKHAFGNRKKGRINIELREKKNHVFLKIKDNGAGLPDGFDTEKVNSMGSQLIQTLTRQLNGNYQLESTDNGTLFTLDFPKENIVKGSQSAGYLGIKGLMAEEE